MYKKIMVPLDGSELAECVLPHLETFLSGSMVSTVVLIRVIEPTPTKFRGSYVTGDDHLAQIEANTREIEEARKASALEYLQKVLRGIRSADVQLHTEVLIGKIADRLIDYAEENDVDLILIATHGRSGISRWVRGSIADRILTGSRVPVFMVRAPGMIKEMQTAA
jgi:nucleotide-binding universal stress UspA family protein